MEIIALSSELVAFVLSEISERKGVFFIAQSPKFKAQRLARLL
jgi:hypothetical protein